MRDLVARMRRRAARAGAALPVLLGLCGAILAGEAADDGPAAAALTPGERIYLRSLLEARQAQELSADEERLVARLRKRLAGQPPAPTAKADRREVEARLVELLRAAVARDPDAREPRLDLARYYLYANAPDLAVRHLERVGPGSEQDLFWPLLSAHAYLRLGEHQTGADLLDRAVRAAGNLVPLQVVRGLFCADVDGLGQYEPRPHNTFRRGEAAWLYVELKGPVFKPVEEKLFRLNLVVDLTVRQAKLQNTVWKRSEYCRLPFEYQHPVAEVFGGIYFNIPAELADGDYVLIITCRDLESEHEDSLDVPFTVGRPPSPRDGAD
jgi:hypothetical protein